MCAWSIGLALALTACGENTGADQSEAEAELEEPLPVMGPERTVLAFGDSLFAGYQLKTEEGYPERLENALRAQGVNARVIDAAVSGDTTAAGRQRLPFVLDNLSEAPDLALVELGGNDLLRGLPPAETRANLEAIITELQRRDIPVLLMGLRAPPNAGVPYQKEFDAVFPALAKAYDLKFIPFWVESLVGRYDLRLTDRIHPTAEGVELLVADTIDEVKAAIPEAD